MGTKPRRPASGIRVCPLGSTVAGYRVLASWKVPETPRLRRSINSWVPVLAPSHVLTRDYREGRIGWKEFRKRYLWELRSPSAQDLLKPFALLSNRKKVLLLCDCSEEKRCPTDVLAEALNECRSCGVYVLDMPVAPAGCSTFARRLP